MDFDNKLLKRLISRNKWNLSLNSKEKKHKICSIRILKNRLKKQDKGTLILVELIIYLTLSKTRISWYDHIKE